LATLSLIMRDDSTDSASDCFHNASYLAFSSEWLCW
jgi:hypothetical protein